MSVTELIERRVDDDDGELAAFERFCRGLTLAQGGPLILEPYELVALADYFAGVIETLIILGKKNGKTTLLAALALYHLITTPDAECLIAASSREQASIMYDQATGFIRRSPRLQKLVVAKRGYREIRSLVDAGRIRVLAADVDTLDGVIPTLGLIDELGRHRKADLYGVIRDGLSSRNGQMVGISAAGDHASSPLGVIRDAARKLPTRVDGRYTYALAEDGSFAMHEWALLDDDDVDDMATVKLVNPLSTMTVEKLQKAHDSPSMLPWQWKRFRCGLWAAADTWWVKPVIWQGCSRSRTDGIKAGDMVALGFDGSRFHDATALVACRLEDALLQLLALWEKPEGASEWEVPAGEVDAALAEAMEEFKVVRGYFDPPLWQSEIDAWSVDFGDEAVMRYWTNRARFMAASERFRTDLVGGIVQHVEDEALTRHVLNTQLREVRGGYLLIKGRGTNEANDAAVAAVLAYEARCDAVASGADVDRGDFAFL